MTNAGQTQDYSKTAVRDAATIVVLRSGPNGPRVLMGQRGATAAFMPSKFVFPGGAVDPTDGEVPLAGSISSRCAAHLDQESTPGRSHALCVAAIRELWEETGLRLGTKAPWPSDPAHDWMSFAATGHMPDASALRFIFRAITPPGRPRRFDARFFLLDAAHLTGDLDDFSNASDELSHLHWVPLSEARALDLPFITEVVLAEVAKRGLEADAPQSVPFFNNSDEESLFLRLDGKRPLDLA